MKYSVKDVSTDIRRKDHKFFYIHRDVNGDSKWYVKRLSSALSSGQIWVDNPKNATRFSSRAEAHERALNDSLYMKGYDVMGYYNEWSFERQWDNS